MKSILALGLAVLINTAIVQQTQAEEGKVVGIGVAIEQKNGKAIVIKEIIANSPASKSELIRVGDFITEVKSNPEAEWVTTYGKTLEEVTQMIRGDVGVAVGLKVYHPDTHGVDEVSIVRAEIEAEGDGHDQGHEHDPNCEHKH